MDINKERVILHIDMDSFYASIEIRENPNLSNRPVVVGIGPNVKEYKGVVSTASYTARKYGIKSGMPLLKAYKKKKDIIVIPARISYYRKVSKKIMTILKKYADKFQQVSIDEAYLDVSNKIKEFGDIYEIIKSIKNEIYTKEKLTCSIGVGPNKSIAKIASAMNKPSGITIITKDNFKKILSPLSVDKIPGIGVKISSILKKNGIITIGDIIKTPKSKLISILGKKGEKIYNIATGQENSEVKPKDIVKSIGFMKTLEISTNEKSIITDILRKLSIKIVKKLKSQKLKFKTVNLTIRLDNFILINRSKTLLEYSNDFELLFKTIIEIFENIFTNKIRKINKIGVKVSNLKRETKVQKLIIEFLK